MSKPFSSIQRLFFLFVCLWISSCSSPQGSREPFAGTYYGELPCADCPGIYYQVTLNPDFTYTDSIFYLDRSTNAGGSQGKFELKGDSLLILKGRSPGEGMHTFAISGQQLTMRNMEGKPIESPLADKYILRTTKPEGFSLVPAATARNIEFKATGNEPSWVLEIEFTRDMHFKSEGPQAVDFTVHVSDTQELQDVPGISYRGRSTAGDMDVTVFRRKCQGSMTGDSADYAVEVSLKTASMPDYATYKGCGAYQGDYRLNDIWVLESMNGKPVPRPQSGNPPNIELQLTAGRIMGYAGCNRFQGPLSVSAQTVTIGALMSTKMACPALKLEKQLLQALSNQTLTFALANRKLTLSSPTTQLTFRKVD